MAYLHCHTKGCGWEQDDFYSKRYNPATKIWDDLKWLAKPRIISIDDDIAEDLLIYTRVPVIRLKGEYAHQFYCFSWNWLLLEIVKDLRLAVKMKWWTRKKFQRDFEAGKARCPRCKSSDMFDID